MFVFDILDTEHSLDQSNSSSVWIFQHNYYDSIIYLTGAHQIFLFALDLR